MLSLQAVLTLTATAFQPPALRCSSVRTTLTRQWLFRNVDEHGVQQRSKQRFPAFTKPQLSAMVGLCFAQQTAPTRCSCCLSMPSALTEPFVRSCAAEDLQELLERLQSDVEDGIEGQRRLLAIALARAGELTVAEPHARCVLESKPDDVEMLFLTGVAHQSRDELDEALDAFESVLAIEPGHWRTNFHLGKMALGVGMIKDAQSYFEEVLKSNPSHEPSIEIMSRLFELDAEAVESDIAEATLLVDDDGELKHTGDDEPAQIDDGEEA